MVTIILRKIDEWGFYGERGNNLVAKAIIK
jgi:hypothetical protein